MSARTPGTSWMRSAMTMNATTRYAMAMNGTMICVALAMRRTPPKMTIAVNIARMPPTTILKVLSSRSREPPTASTMELVWMALYTKP